MPVPKVIRQGPTWSECCLGDDPKLFFGVHRLEFDEGIEDVTDGKFVMLNLVEGERCEIVTDGDVATELRFAESIVIPAADVTTMALIVAMFAWAGPTRVLRSQMLSLREQGYVWMARLSGQSSFSIMFREIMPDLMPYLAATFVGSASGGILAAVGLEALGLGPQQVPTLGMTIYYALQSAAIIRGMWWWWGAPTVILIVLFTSFFLITIGFDEIANPRLRGARA